MSGTVRRSYDGETVHDGEYGKKCGSANCDACVTGHCKRPARRAIRRARRGHIAASETGNA